MFKFGTGPH